MRRLLSQRSRSGTKPRHRRSDVSELPKEPQEFEIDNQIHPLPPLKNVGVFVASQDHPGMKLANALIKDGSYNTTLIVTEGVDVSPPSSVRLVKIRPDLPRIQLTQAIVGQETLIVAPGFGHRENETRVADAAFAAGVKEILVVECGMEPTDFTINRESHQVQSMRNAVQRFQSINPPRLHWGIVAFGLPSVLDSKTPIDINAKVEMVRLPLPERNLSNHDLHNLAADIVVTGLRNQSDLFNRTLRAFILDPDMHQASHEYARSSTETHTASANPVIEIY